MKPKQIISSKLTVFFLVALLAFFSDLRYKQYKSEREVEMLKQDLEAQANTQAKRAQDLKDSLGYLNSDSFKEKIAREQLNLKKDGEIVYNFSQANTVPAAPASGRRPQTNAQKWWQYLFQNPQ